MIKGDNIMNQFEKELVNIQNREAINDFMETFESTLRLIGVAVKTQKSYFDELVKEGFTEEQALEIIKVHGIDIGRVSHMKNSEPEE